MIYLLGQTSQIVISRELKEGGKDKKEEEGEQEEDHFLIIIIFLKKTVTMHGSFFHDMTILNHMITG